MLYQVCKISFTILLSFCTTSHKKGAKEATACCLCGWYYFKTLPSATNPIDGAGRTSSDLPTVGFLNSSLVSSVEQQEKPWSFSWRYHKTESQGNQETMLQTWLGRLRCSWIYQALLSFQVLDKTHQGVLIIGHSIHLDHHDIIQTSHVNLVWLDIMTLSCVFSTEKVSPGEKTSITSLPACSEFRGSPMAVCVVQPTVRCVFPLNEFHPYRRRCNSFNGWLQSSNRLSSPRAVTKLKASAVTELLGCDLPNWIWWRVEIH